MHLSLLLGLASAVLALPREVATPNLSPNPNTGLRTLYRRDLPIGTCNPSTPCPNGACCGSNGLCGYSPTECGTGCASNCDAKAACGQYGEPGSQTCPLNVCCSKFGFCGSTDDFCGDGCQEGFGGCGPPPTPPCGGSQVGKRNIGYYESWANTRQCQAVSPEDLNLAGFSHLNFAFASFDPKSFQITPMDSNSASLYGRTTALKNKWSGLEVWISVGGWSFTDPGPTQEAFSNMVSTASNRQAFISGLIQFMNTYNFDGVDVDWEYPQADDRGGQEGDKVNYVTFVKELRSALGNKGISLTLPTSFWYLQHIDVNGLQDSVDWFNFMAYDLHGTWDQASKFVGPYIAPHTNLTEIDLGLDLLWRAGVSADKVVLGQGWYGRSFTLTNPSCNTPNSVCEFSGGANPGPCSATSGILDDQEIQDIITKNNLQPVWDKTAGVKWITWDSNQWVSYDDDDTFNQKRDFAEKRCLGGLMVWALDQKDQSGNGNLNNGVSAADQSNAQSLSGDAAAKTSCYVTDCNQECKSGTNQVAQMNGQPGQVSTRDRCPAKQYRNLCCADGTTTGKCTWRGFRGSGMSCIQGCSDGETELTTDTNNHVGKKDQTCNGGLQSFCCSNFKAPPSLQSLGKDAADAAKSAAEAAAQQLALDIAAKAFCRVVVPALLAPLELLEDLIPIFGEIADIAEIAATPALIKLCTDEIEKTGKAEFKVFGKEHSLSLNEPPPKAPETRPPKSSHEPEKTSSACNSKRMDGGGRCLRAETITETNQPIRTEHPHNPRGAKVCDVAVYGQACLHYASVIETHAAFTPDVNPLTCATSYKNNPPHITQKWTNQHNPGWWQGYIQQQYQDCQKDEYPPAAFWWDRDDDDVLIRLIPGAQNGGAGSSLFGNQAFVCGYDNKNGLAPRSTRNLRSAREQINGNRRTIYETMDLTITLSTLELDFLGTAAYPDYGVVQNPCWPSTVVVDPGFALLTDDPWYIHNPQYTVSTHLYPGAPPVAATQGKSRAGYQKRDADIISQYGRAASSQGAPSGAKPFRPESILLDDGNSTRRANEADLAEHFNLRRCTTPDCREEVAQHNVEAVLLDPSFAIPGAGDATSSFTATADTSAQDTGSIVTAVEETIAVPTPAAVGEGAAHLTLSLPAPTRK